VRLRESPGPAQIAFVFRTEEWLSVWVAEFLVPIRVPTLSARLASGSTGKSEGPISRTVLSRKPTNREPPDRSSASLAEVQALTAFAG